MELSCDRLLADHYQLLYMEFPGYILQRVLPSRQRVHQFITELTHYLFPVVDDVALFMLEHSSLQYKLSNQLRDMLHATQCKQGFSTDQVLDNFFAQLPQVKDMLLQDAEMILQFDPAAESMEEVILSYPGFLAIMVHRLSHELYKCQIPVLPRMISEWAHSRTGIDIHPGAQIGCPFFIDHGTGVVIGETSIVGNNVKVYQGVTLGAAAVRKEEAKQKRHPTIQDNVVIYAGSTILGGNTVIGRDSIIGGNTWVTKSIPPFSLVYSSHQSVITDRKEFSEPINFII